MKGVHHRMGDDMRPGMGISIHHQWSECTGLALGFLAASHGEEIVKMDLKDPILCWGDAGYGKNTFCSCATSRKGQTGHCHRIISQTIACGIHDDLWVETILKFRRKQEINQG